MTDELTSDTPAVRAAPRANLALGLALAAIAAWVAGVALDAGDDYGWMWLVMTVLGAAAFVDAATGASDRAVEEVERRSSGLRGATVPADG